MEREIEIEDVIAKFVKAMKVLCAEGHKSALWTRAFELDSQLWAKYKVVFTTRSK
jgi:hypothetical protein